MIFLPPEHLGGEHVITSNGSHSTVNIVGACGVAALDKFVVCVDDGKAEILCKIYHDYQESLQSTAAT